MPTYAIVETSDEGETFYLNHSCMSTLSFGSEDMAWTTDDHEKAELMLDKVERVKGTAFSEFDITEF